MKKGNKNSKPGTFHAEEWISQAGAARIRGVSRQAIGSLIERGRLRVRRVGGKPLVNRKEVEQFVPWGGPLRLAYLIKHANRPKL
jgi:excisionase family DNA binding protein